MEEQDHKMKFFVIGKNDKWPTYLRIPKGEEVFERVSMWQQWWWHCAKRAQQVTEQQCSKNSCTKKDYVPSLQKRVALKIAPLNEEKNSIEYRRH